MSEPLIYSLEEVHRFVKDCLVAVETSENHAEELARSLTFADYRGCRFKGLSSLDTYLKQILDGGCDKNAVPAIIRENPATALVNGKNGLGVVVGNFCMSLAIRKAKEIGIGCVVARGSNQYGLGSYFANQAQRHKMVGISFSNARPLVAPPYSATRAIGTNPIGIAAPALEGEGFFLDVTTSAVSSGKIEMLSKTHGALPVSWANMSTGALHPLGGDDVSQSLKGFGLGMMVEILTGILSGGGYSLHLPHYGTHSQPSNLGQCFVAVNPAFFEAGFEERLTDFLHMMHSLEPASTQESVMMVGDTEREHMEKVEQDGGVSYTKHVVAMCTKLAKKLNVQPLQSLN